MCFGDTEILSISGLMSLTKLVRYTRSNEMRGWVFKNNF